MFSASEAAKRIDAFQIERDSATQDKLDIVDKTRASIFPWRGQFSPLFVEHKLSEFKAKAVLDPFCGSGTTLYEAATENIRSAGADINPAAFLLSSLVTFCSQSKEARQGKLNIVSEGLLRSPSLKISWGIGGEVIPLEAVQELSDSFRNDQAAFAIYSATVMLGIGNGEEFTTDKLAKGFKRVHEILTLLPFSAAGAEPVMADARRLPFNAGEFDLVITSPPYINVFNYHQNYRKVMEAIGFEPLRVATAEIGSNRKHRQNRFLTVIQYCIDMGSALQEMQRLLTGNGHIVMVVGRTSSVRSVQFENGKLLAMVATEGLGFKLDRRQERVFTNRFGERIVEDILTLRPGKTMADDYTTIGREVGKWALENAVISDQEPIVLSEIQAAISGCDQVRESLFLDTKLSKAVEGSVLCKGSRNHIVREA